MKSTKICRLCKEEKPLTQFYKHLSTKDKLRGECIPCWNKNAVSYYLANKSKMAAKRKAYHFRRNYGLTLKQVEKLKQSQKHICPICNEVTKLVVDHDHSSGKLRGMLCSCCNQAIGSLKDKPENCLRAAQYLQLHGG